jgi:hypothetical protein
VTAEPPLHPGDSGVGKGIEVGMTPADRQALVAARALLENPSLAARIADLAGSPIEYGFELLPEGWRGRVHDATRAALERALALAVESLHRSPARAHGDTMHRWAATVSGGVGGAFGLPALALELPVSTTIMLRSIAEIAAGQGEDLALPEARLQCLQVLALGGPSPTDDAADTGYFAARAALARAVSEAASHVARRGLAGGSAPALVRLISQIAARFSIVVSQKAAAQAVPVVGALGGAWLNRIFIDHFQAVARGHFTVRRLERVWGVEAVREQYRLLGGSRGEAIVRVEE